MQGAKPLNPKLGLFQSRDINPEPPDLGKAGLSKGVKPLLIPADDQWGKEPDGRTSLVVFVQDPTDDPINHAGGWKGKVVLMSSPLTPLQDKDIVTSPLIFGDAP